MGKIQILYAGFKRYNPDIRDFSRMGKEICPVLIEIYSELPLTSLMIGDGDIWHSILQRCKVKKIADLYYTSIIPNRNMPRYNYLIPSLEDPFSEKNNIQIKASDGTNRVQIMSDDYESNDFLDNWLDYPEEPADDYDWDYGISVTASIKIDMIKPSIVVNEYGVGFGVIPRIDGRFSDQEDDYYFPTEDKGISSPVKFKDDAQFGGHVYDHHGNELVTECIQGDAYEDYITLYSGEPTGKTFFGQDIYRVTITLPRSTGNARTIYPMGTNDIYETYSIGTVTALYGAVYTLDDFKGVMFPINNSHTSTAYMIGAYLGSGNYVYLRAGESVDYSSGWLTIEYTMNTEGSGEEEG